MGEQGLTYITSPTSIYCACWFLLSCILLLATKLYIPYYIHSRQQQQEAAEHEETFSLGKLLVVGVGLTLIVVSNLVVRLLGLSTTDFPVLLLVGAGLISCQLLLLTLHDPVRQHVLARISVQFVQNIALPDWCLPWNQSNNRVDPVV